ncbi:hypothetical protein Geob_3129 [Geotalea daltonii FRC-32]|uniref:Phage abortive infection protein n=1 Tax=Geotalea daltonii (strain DSM 22248 / JCM 15807 / FRC-32) TaxID=316067 RepID=B9M3Q1_GEODF|nr:hypothetical protein [Geotalea daltonii]ACM21472.1 hypothetical protein Geob_3129 [Geotalea daltonii FRC-32]
MDKYKDMIDDKLIRNLVLLALVPLALCALAYFIRFGWIMKYPISPNQSDWGTFGDFIGGVLNPIYAFLAFIGVIYTVLLQKRQLTDMKTQQKLEELQQLIFGIAETIDKVLFEQKHKYKSNDFNVFTLLRSISDDSIRIELNPSHPISCIYDDIRTSVIELISFDLTYVSEQLSHLIWCLENYEKNQGSKEIKDFYIGKYRNVVFMMKQVRHLHLEEVEVFFKVDEVKKTVIDAIKASR